MDHSKHLRLRPEELTPDLLSGATIYGPDDSKIGKIEHIHNEGGVMQVVVDVGGFLGIGAKPVVLNVDQIDLMRDESGNVHGVTSWTKDRLLELPEHRH